MEMMEFEGTYNLLDYNISHSVLLFRRSGGGPEDKTEKNMDLIFESVFYLEIVTRMTDIRIYGADGGTITYVEQKRKERIYKEFGETVLILESGGRHYLIGCTRLIIQENTNLPLVSSIK